jgi:hypothetical protein
MFFGKAYGFLLQALLVIGAVVLFSFFDPFGIMVSTKLKLKDTPISVQSVREIGELITAEYYGEVVKSYKGESKAVTNAYLESVDDGYKEYSKKLKSLVSSVDSKKKNQLFKAFKEEFPDYNSDHYFLEFIHYVHEVKNNDFNKNDFGKTASKSEIKNVLLLYSESSAPYSFEEFRTAYNNEKDKENKKLIKRKRLVLLGRGTVKAGYNFKEFNQSNFKYDKEAKRVHLVGMHAEILSKTINPWFAPEKAIPGFEFLIAERKARRRPDILKQVKQECLDELLHKAKEAHILSKAKENAIANLTSFFSLLIGDEIEVFIHGNEFEYYLTLIKEDGFKSPLERETIDEALNDLISGTDTLEAIHQGIDFLDQIAKLNSLDHPNTYYNQLNRFQGLYHKTMADGVVDKAEIKMLLSLKNFIVPSQSSFLLKIPDSIEVKLDTAIVLNENEKNLALAYIGEMPAILDLIWADGSHLSNLELYANNEHDKALQNEVTRLYGARISAYNRMVEQFSNVTLELSSLSGDSNLVLIQDKHQLHDALRISSENSIFKTDYQQDDIDLVTLFLDSQPRNSKKITIPPSPTFVEVYFEEGQNDTVQSPSLNDTISTTSLNIESDTVLIHNAVLREEEKIEKRKKKGFFNWVSKPFKKKKKKSN